MAQAIGWAVLGPWVSGPPGFPGLWRGNTSWPLRRSREERTWLDPLSQKRSVAFPDDSHSEDAQCPCAGVHSQAPTALGSCHLAGGVASWAGGLPASHWLFGEGRRHWAWLLWSPGPAGVGGRGSCSRSLSRQLSQWPSCPRLSALVTQSILIFSPSCSQPWAAWF